MVAPILLVLFACQRASEEENSSHIQQSVNVPFSRWCENFSPEKCKVDQAQSIDRLSWQAGVDVFQTFVGSSTRLQLRREDLNRPAVIRLYQTLGASGLLNFLRSLPWETFVVGDGRIVLGNQSDEAVIDVDDLKLIGGREVVFKFSSPRVLSVSGFRLESSSGQYSTPVLAIDFSEPDQLTLVTPHERIVGVPVKFFNKTGLTSKVAFSPSALLKSLFDVILEPEFDWRKNLFVLLGERELASIFNSMRPLLPEGPALQFMSALFQNMSAVTSGGPQGLVLSIQMKNAMSCTMTIGQIPVIGRVNVTTKYAAGFGFSELQRMNDATLAAKIYGVVSPVGLVQRLEVDGEEIRAKVGPFTAPLNFEQVANRNGPRLDAVQCR